MFSDLECILTYCDNATEEPNNNGANYNFTWDGNRIPIDTFVTYPCQDGMAIENATKWKNLSSTESLVFCDPSDGLMKVLNEGRNLLNNLSLISVPSSLAPMFPDQALWSSSCC